MRHAIVVGLLLFSTAAWAESDFCRGFSEGYKTIKGDMALVPICPLEPITPIGSNSYREGIKAGIAAAAEDG